METLLFRKYFKDMLMSCLSLATIGFGATLCLLWAWPKHMEAGRSAGSHSAGLASLASLIKIHVSPVRVESL